LPQKPKTANERKQAKLSLSSRTGTDTVMFFCKEYKTLPAMNHLLKWAYKVKDCA